MTTHKAKKRHVPGQRTLNGGPAPLVPVETGHVETAASWTIKLYQGDELKQLREIAACRRSARLAETVLVGRARAAGISWSDIGAALDMSAQGAQQRNADV